MFCVPLCDVPPPLHKIGTPPGVAYGAAEQSQGEDWGWGFGLNDLVINEFQPYRCLWLRQVVFLPMCVVHLLH